MEIIKKGHTNKIKYFDGDKFVLEKTKTGFNHRIDYKILNAFDFVPEVLEHTEDKVISARKDDIWLTKPNNDDLKELGLIFRKIHTSDIKFPKNNLREILKSLLKKVHDKKIHIPAIEDNWVKMNRVLGKMGRLNPCHNDLWMQNILKDNNGKIWLVDWEYATMGDKHFDLAFYIESQRLNEKQEAVLLDSYNSTDEYQAWIPEWMNRYKMFVHWYTIIWVYAQDKKPFDTTWMEARIEELKNK
ncbi:MAG: phosphotransferase [Mycoplasmataceae bacterium]|nr:phosphotransferase [Mycoplasmataceae bacterium]